MKKPWERILLAHGGGGEEMWELVESVFVSRFSGGRIKLEDSAVVELGGRLYAFTADGFTVSPIFFPGGDIGKLAVTGTANDLAVAGAKPLFISACFIIEEGFERKVLEKIAESMKRSAEEIGARVVTGDTKVVPKGSADGLYIATSGIGEVIVNGISGSSLDVGDVIIVSGPVGDHGACIMAQREGLSFGGDLRSDCAHVWGLVEALFEEGVRVKAMRDPTRGGISAVLNEWARASGVEIELYEENVPVREPVRGLCEILGIEVLELACEGRLVVAVPEGETEKALSALRKKGDSEPAVIARVVKRGWARVILRSPFGTGRILDPPKGEAFPRIC